MSDEKVKVLIVEDNPADAFMIEEMLKELKMELNIKIVEDGLEAVNLLKNKGNVVPDLIILDLNLPRMDGFDVLKLMKNADDLRTIPVVVLTGSLKKEDEVRARRMGADDYCLKPATVEEMETTMMCLRDHLMPSRSKGRGDGTGPLINMDPYISQSPFEERRTPPSYNERLIEDHLDDGLWNKWY